MNSLDHLDDRVFVAVTASASHLAAAGPAGLLIAWRDAGVVTAVLVAPIAFARVYVAAHYLGDGVVGLLVGATVVAVGWMLVRPPAWVTDGLRGMPPLRAAFAAGTGRRSPETVA